MLGAPSNTQTKNNMSDTIGPKKFLLDLSGKDNYQNTLLAFHPTILTSFPFFIPLIFSSPFLHSFIPFFFLYPLSSLSTLMLLKVFFLVL